MSFSYFIIKPTYDNAKSYKKEDRKKYIANDKPIKDIRYIFRPKNGDIGIKDEVLSDIRTLFEPEEDYYKPVKIVNAFDYNFIVYENNEDKEKTLSIEEYLNEYLF